MNITRSQSILLAVVGLAVFFAIGIVFSLRSPKGVVQSAKEVKFAVDPENGANIRLNDFQRSETKDGKKVWEVKGRVGEYFPEHNLVKIGGADLWLYRKDGEVIHLVAEEATVELEGNSLRSADLRKNVLVDIQSRGATIETDHAIYSKTDDIVRAPGPVKFHNEMMDLSGISLIAHVSARELTLEQHVESVIRRVKKEKK